MVVSTTLGEKQQSYCKRTKEKLKIFSFVMQIHENLFLVLSNQAFIANNFSYLHLK